MSVRNLFHLLILAIGAIFLSSNAAHAAVFGQIQGIVHDPQHRPIAGAHITIRAANSYLSFSATSGPDGSFSVATVPLGDYTVAISAPGFAEYQQAITVTADTTVILHFPMTIATVRESAVVHAIPESLTPSTVTPSTLVNRVEIARTPGADLTNSVAMITDYVPGAYVTHDMVHMRGGHELSWLIDGVEIPNTNIASNIAPQIDPKDIDTLEVERGSYGANIGDRTYGVFNIVPRTGFEYNHDGELVVTAGSFDQTNDQISIGNHSDKAGWFTSLNGNRSNFGLEPAIEQPIHDAENGYGGFGSYVYNHDQANQLRLVGQLRTDYYQIPYDPNPADWQNQLYDSSGLRDGEHETDSYATLTWVHTWSPETLLQMSPFYHFNTAKYEPHSYDLPTATSAYQTGNYVGLQASIATVVKKNSLSAGLYGYGQHEHDLFGVIFNNFSSPNFSETDTVPGGVEEVWVQDNYKPKSWLTLIAGERQSHFQATISENAVYPRLGIAIQIPKLNWVFRGFYGHFYQPPPLTTIAGPLLAYANSTDTSFAPLYGERNEEHQFGLEIPLRGWMLDADTFQTEAKNFLDHSNIGESSVFIPITVQRALVQAWELTIASPSQWRYGHAHLAYSNQIAKESGPITGGLICYPPGSAACTPPPGYTPLDHDQRNTLNVGLNGNMPYGVFGSFNVYYGSGFDNGYPSPPSPYLAEYLPGHTTADVALGKTFAEKFTVSVNDLNVSNTRVLLDNSLTFGGFHYNNPREIYGEVRYRFHY